MSVERAGRAGRIPGAEAGPALALERGPEGCGRVAAAHGDTLVSALGILFNTGAGQHILKNPLVVNSIIDKVGAAAARDSGLAGRACGGPAAGPWPVPHAACSSVWGPLGVFPP